MKVELTASSKEHLRLIQHSAKERWLYVRVTIILMLSEGFTVEQVRVSLGIDDNTVYRTAHNYGSLSLSRFLMRDYDGYVGKFSYTQLSELRRKLSSRLFTKTEEVCNWARARFGVEMSAKGMARLLGRIGFVYKKTKHVPCEADPAKQEAFLEALSGYLSQADASVYYLDAVHPTHNTRSMYGWIESGKDFELPTVSGRDRVNINGAVDAKDPTRIIAREDATINAQSTKALYEAILEANPASKTIFAISDNARYYRNKELKEWLEGTRIVQVFLPAYSPNLNLIERLWKLLRKKVIDPVFYRTKEEFRAGVLSFLADTAPYAEALKSLLTLNFRVVGSGKSFHCV